MKLSFFLVCLLIFAPFAVKAQLCNGNLGDPIINYTFGTGSSKLPAYITSFEYAGGCPGEGKYSVANFLLGCGDRTWFLLAGDHTRDVGGSYMVVNAASTPGTVYIDTANGLCDNTTYQFSAWITNVMQKFSCGGVIVLPNLTFKVATLAGVVVATYNTGNLPITEDKIWNQYGLSFKTTPGINDVVLSITTTPVNGCGSSFAIDDIVLGMCGPAVTTTLDGNITPAIDVCADYADPFILNASYAPGFADPVVQWQSSTDSGKTWQNLAGAVSTTYTIPRRTSGVVSYRVLLAERPNINSINCRITSNSIATTVHPKPAHQSPQRIRGCLGKDLILPYPSDISTSILWNGPNGFTSDKSLSVVPNVQYADTGLYKLTQQYNSGCSTLDSFYLGVFPGATVIVNPVQSICEGKSVVLSASGGERYEWSPAQGLSNDTIANPVASPQDSTEYRVTISNSYGCRDSALVNVQVFRNPAANAGPERKMYLGDSIILNASVQGTAVDFYWSPANFINDILTINPTVYPPEEMQYTLMTLSTLGCGSASATVKIKVYKDIYIPNAFTPNDDGINDFFHIIAADNYKQFNLQIFNRWGKVVFKTTDINKQWNGRLNGEQLAAGSYSYYVDILKATNKRFTKKGTILLLR